ncbi:hypothetical protein [Burkholderia ubonensis]|uniref:hypothetical protein n=1 Tax=Burkholderia ubonensis TaxID=101571 RepID=UPI000B215C2F|nr:hypothetical protein [Burkholderia ubonensis]
MFHPYLIVAGIAATFVLAVVFALLLWRRFHPAPPTATAVPATPALATPHRRYASDEEWEAHAPYPQYALQEFHASGWGALPSENRHRSRDHLTFDVETFETDDPPTFHHRAQPTTTDSDYSPYAPPIGHDLATSSSIDVMHRCPQCNSSRVDTLNIGRKAGSTIGSVAGATSGMAMAFSGAEAGAAVGAIGGPLGSVFGGVAGAVIAGLLGSAAGCAAGSAVGAAIDENVLDNYRCMSCGHTFSAQPD